MSELKPCQCGGKAEIEQTGRHQITIRCEGCGIMLKQKVIQRSLSWLHEKMVEMWNRRAADETLKAAREEWRGLMDKYNSGREPSPWFVSEILAAWNAALTEQEKEVKR